MMFVSALKMSTMSGIRLSKTMLLTTRMKHFSISTSLPLSLDTTLTYPNLLVSHRSCRYLSTTLTDKQGSNSSISKEQGENKLKTKLSQTFPNASSIQVEDISGGCGSMYQIHVESADFKGLNTVKQHQLITKALQDEIKEMHGVRISTKVPANP